jgi:hypothetical protein
MTTNSYPRRAPTPEHVPSGNPAHRLGLRGVATRSLLAVGLLGLAGSARAFIQPVAEGQNVTLTVASDGTAPFAYQWFKDGWPIAGATEYALAISNALASASGDYTASVANEAGSALAEPVTLSVTAVAVRPTLTTQPVSQTVTAGATVSFTAAASGTPAPTYQWSKDGAPLTGATNSTLTLAGVTSAQAGTYTMTATNSAGSVVSTGALLTVNPAPTPPVILVGPASQTVGPGAVVTFSVLAGGSPSPTYQWLRNGVTLTGATAASYTLFNVGSAQAGTYAVIVANPSGSVTSAGAVLTVTDKPVIVAQPASQTVTSGSPVTLTVGAVGKPTLGYQWFMNGSRIKGATSPSYTLASATASSAASYTVSVKNAAGSVTSDPAVISVRSSTATIVLRTDLNADSQADLLWMNTATGAAQVWLMNGNSRSATVALDSPGLPWILRGSGDFNADNRPDLLWQNVLTGEVRIALAGGSTVTLPVRSPEWQLAGSGDFNGDARSDLVWQNEITGERQLWLMAGTGPSATVSLGFVPIDWEIVGTGDLNRDGQSDLLAQNLITGEAQIWLMAGTTRAQTVSLGAPPPGWELCGAADLNLDGRSDLLWQHAVTGERTTWLMSAPDTGTAVTLGSLDPAWLLAN